MARGTLRIADIDTKEDKYDRNQGKFHVIDIWNFKP